MLTDFDLERQAERMAVVAMGRWGGVPSERMAAVTAQIFQRLKQQRSSPDPQANSHSSTSRPKAPLAGKSGKAVSQEDAIVVSGSGMKGLNGRYVKVAREHDARPCWKHVEDPFFLFYSAAKGMWFISERPEDKGFTCFSSASMMPPEGIWSKGTTIRYALKTVAETEPLDGVELCGDEAWFLDATIRKRLRESVVEGHREQKIIVGPPAQEVARICPASGHVLGAGAVLRLGGAHLGGYGEADIAYAYRQLSRALHPDRNPDLAGASDAFLRLKAASDELRQALNEQRLAVHSFVAVFEDTATEEMLERPQEALFAEDCRLLATVCALEGEGWVIDPIKKRAISAYNECSQIQSNVLLESWFGSGQLLDLHSAASVRTAYDCAPKRFRAQFLCFLNRCLLAEATRNEGCVRSGWPSVLDTFPELGLWRDFRDRIQERVWAVDPDDGPHQPRERSRSRGSGRKNELDTRKIIAEHPLTGERAGRWALKWRKALAVVLPSGLDSAVSISDPEVRMLCKAMWKDIVSWAGQERCLELFRAEPPHVPQRGLPPGAAPAEWCFIPMSDLLLTIGSGLVGITAEGVYAANRSGHERSSLAKFYKK